MRMITAFRFQPFESRQGQDTVIGLRFKYDAQLVAGLKSILKQCRGRAVRKDRHQHSAGGWLPEHKVWFVEENVWPRVALALKNALPDLEIAYSAETAELQRRRIDG